MSIIEPPMWYRVLRIVREPRHPLSFKEGWSPTLEYHTGALMESHFANPTEQFYPRAEPTITSTVDSNVKPTV